MTTTKADGMSDERKVDVLHAIDQADVALGVAGLPQNDIFRRELRAASSAVAELIEAVAAEFQAVTTPGWPAARERVKAALAVLGATP